MKLQTITLGCSKNKVDTEHILSQVEDLYEIVPEGEDIPVDVLLLNTCGFIGDAKEESVQAILEAVERKSRGEVGKLGKSGNDQKTADEVRQQIDNIDGGVEKEDTCRPQKKGDDETCHDPYYEAAAAFDSKHINLSFLI